MDAKPIAACGHARVLDLTRVFHSPEVQELLSIDADTELKLKDGTVKANSSVLKVFSSVLRSALEAGDIGRSKQRPSASVSVEEVTHGSSKLFQVPLNDITSEEWDVAAPFWVPVRSVPDIIHWWQVEVLLKVGSLLDIQPLLAKADDCIEQHLVELLWQDEDPRSIWKWLRLADKSGLTKSLHAVVQRIRYLHNSNGSPTLDALKLEGLSPLALVPLVTTFSTIDTNMQGGYNVTAQQAELSHPAITPLDHVA